MRKRLWFWFTANKHYEVIVCIYYIKPDHSLSLTLIKCCDVLEKNKYDFCEHFSDTLSIHILYLQLAKHN